MLNDLPLTGKILKKFKVLTVEDAVGEVADPVSQANHPAVFGDTNVEGDMTVSEYKIFNIRILFMLYTGKLELVLIVHSHKRAQSTVFHAALSGPPMGKGHGAIGMDPGIKPLHGPVLK